MNNTSSNTSSSSSSLIEPGIKYFIGHTLKECHKFKEGHYSTIFNVTMCLLFLLVVGSFLIYCYKGKPTKLELEVKSRHKQEYIVSKLQQMALHKKKESQTLITDLPSWETL